ncbi:transcriptional regulator [Leptolyngbyaceae cyanobacterium CCMR0082]|uniref:Transcriptional regulator n=2 Tax=Adonisia turfae TaxID=2950184 RepID=A0A6M0S5Q8_9CYAN|nr:helix-turn-helix domain-containing protein [Adonisia turfae]MDV3353459.1 helix-turn-helix domain-containing protein [Leptothoe sp. LEGE 181152]NEZ56717.1 transcriptional regulator [Adonisia turfae CCMR0081]NEZ63726.1 transcriptional regulator [Adonisia turfae CCMR0082]
MSDAQQLENLTNLGLTRYEAAVYLALLERQDFTPSQLATQAKVPRQRIYDVLRGLCDRNLALERHSGRQRLFQAVDPTQALPGLVQAKQRQYAAELSRQQQQSEAMVAALAPLYAAGHRNQDPLAYVEVLSDPNHINERGSHLAQAAEHSICVFFTYPSLLSYEDGLKLVEGPLKQGITYRTIYEHNVWQDPSSRDFIRQCQDWGQQVRFVAEVPFKMQLFDERVTLLSLQDPVVSSPSFTALSVTHPGLAKTLQLSFEALWREGDAKPLQG